ncbi:MAG: helix-turn-helix domain-containing protein [Candidatus Omnitrophota bacterium]
MADQINKGEFLKKTRETKGISLQTVHEATKIPLDALKSIEEGYTIRTLSSFYIKGFMKLYAKYLGVDISQVIEDYHTEKLPEHIADNKEENIQFKVAVILSNSKVQTVIRLFVIFIFVFALSRAAGCLIQRIRRGSQKTAAVSVKKSPAPIVKKSIDQKKKLSTKKQPVPAKKEEPKALPRAPATATRISDSSPKTEKKINLSVRAKKSTWLQVKVDNMIVFQSEFKRGVVETWSADESIEIAGKNIYELEFELNGKMIGSLGREDRRARKVVVTKNGLSVKR